MNAIERAIDVAGSPSKLARMLDPDGGVSRQRVSYWLKAGRCSAGWALAIEKATGVSRHDLRPDIYPREAA